MYNNEELDRLKRETSILSVAERYGVYAERKGKTYMALCPFHDDHNPSLSLDPIRNTWKCFGCGKSGSVIDFVMEKEGIPFRDAVDKLLTSSGAACPSSGGICRASELQRPKADQQPRPAALPTLSLEERRHVSDVIDYYHRTLSGEDSRGLDYLRRRHIADPETLKAFKVGYCNGTLSAKGGSSSGGNNLLPEAAIPTLKKIGLLRKDGSETFNGCIVIPVFADDGTLGECFARFIVDRDTTNHLYLPGSQAS